MRQCLSCDHFGGLTKAYGNKYTYGVKIAGWCYKWDILLPKKGAETENYSDEWDCYSIHEGPKKVLIVERRKNDRGVYDVRCWRDENEERGDAYTELDLDIAMCVARKHLK